MISSRPMLQPSTRRNSSPSRPPSPTAAAPMARFCGEIILPSTPPERVGRGEQRRVEPGLLGGGHLQGAEQRVRGGVRARDRHAQPADDGGQEGEDAAGAGDPEADGDGLAGEVHDVGERQHGRHRQCRPFELVERLAVDLQRPGRASSAGRPWSRTPEISSSVPAALSQLKLNVVWDGASPSAFDHVQPGPGELLGHGVERVLDRPELGDGEDDDDDEVRRVGLGDLAPRCRGGRRPPCAGPPPRAPGRTRRRRRWRAGLELLARRGPARTAATPAAGRRGRRWPAARPRCP